MPENSPTMIYNVAFWTWSQPNPERLGTAEQVIGQIRVWAKNADDAIDIVRKIAVKKDHEYVGTVSADAVTGVYREQILNDENNPNYVSIDAEIIPFPQVAE